MRRSSVDSRLRPSSCSTPASHTHNRAGCSSPAPRRASSAARSASPASTASIADFGVSWIQPGSQVRKLRGGDPRYATRRSAARRPQLRRRSAT
jgi:hypothetical protein